MRFGQRDFAAGAAGVIRFTGRTGPPSMVSFLQPPI